LNYNFFSPFMYRICLNYPKYLKNKQIPLVTIFMTIVAFKGIIVVKERKIKNFR